MIKSYNSFINESIKDYLKPKSEEDINNYIKDMISDTQLLQGCQFGMLWLVKKI
jgi:hypothetical protein